MPDLQEINDFLEATKYDFVTHTRIRSSDDALLLYVPRNKVRNVVAKGFTSRRQLKRLQNRLSKEFSTEIEIIFTSSEFDLDLEAGFYRLLNLRFDARVLSFYMSFSDEKLVSAWIEFSGLTEADKTDVENYLSELLEGVDLGIGNIYWIDSPLEMPTDIAILRIIKAKQPLGLDSMLNALGDQYTSIDKKWMGRKLDQLRKKGFIQWQKQGESGVYALNASALAVVPSNTNKSSSDIDRALALGRHKW